MKALNAYITKEKCCLVHNISFGVDQLMTIILPPDRSYYIKSIHHGWPAVTSKLSALGID